jgi:glutaredoxin
LGADNRCVICRRDDSELGDATAPAVGTAQYIAGLAAALVTAGIVLAIFKFATDEETGPIVTPDAVTEAGEAAAEPTVDAPRPPPPRAPPPPPSPAFAEDNPVVAAADEEQRLKNQMKKVGVTMYVTPQCALCDRATRWFNKNGFQLRTLDVKGSETDRILLRAVNPAESVPTFDVEGKILIGYSEEALEEAILQAAEKKTARR